MLVDFVQLLPCDLDNGFAASFLGLLLSDVHVANDGVLENGNLGSGVPGEGERGALRVNLNLDLIIDVP